MSEVIMPPVVKRTVWLKKLSPPVRLLVEERIRQAGFADDPDAWVADILTTARHSPQGYVLRLTMSQKVGRSLVEGSLKDTDLFDWPERKVGGE